MAKDTPMTLYLNTHACLEQMRKIAEDDGTRSGPRVSCGLFVTYVAYAPVIVTYVTNSFYSVTKYICVLQPQLTCYCTMSVQ